MPSAQEANSDRSIREARPSLIYTTNEAGEEVVFVDKFPWNEYDKLVDQASETDTNGCQTLSVAMELSARDTFAVVDHRMTVKVLRPGQNRVIVGMNGSHFLTQPKIVNPDDSNASVFAHFDDSSKTFELLVEGTPGQELVLAFRTELPLRKIGSRTFFRMNLPRFPNATLTVAIPMQDAVAGASAGMTVKRILDSPTPSDDASSEQVTAVDGNSDDQDFSDDQNSSSVPEDALESSSNSPLSVFRIDGLLSQFEFWWQPKLEVADEVFEFEVQGDIEVKVSRLGETSSVGTLRLTSYNQPLEGFVVELPERTRWVPDQVTDDYTISVADEVGDRQVLQVVFQQPSSTPPPVRIATEFPSRQQNSDDANRTTDLTGFRVLKASAEYGTVRVFSEGDWTLEFEKGDFTREINSNTDSARTFQYSRLGQLRMRVAKQLSQLLVEPTYVVTVEETVARLTAIYRCNRRGSRQGNLEIAMGDWIFQSVRTDSDAVAMETPELLSPTNGRLEIPLVTQADRFELTLTATLPIENGLVVVSSDESDTSTLPQSTRLSLDLPIPIDSRLLHATIALQNDGSLSVNPGFTTAYSQIRTPETLRSILEPELRPRCFRMRAAGAPSSFPLLAARLARSTTVDTATEILSITADRIRVRQQMNWQVRGVPLSDALLTVAQSICEFGNLRIELDGKPVVYNRLNNFENVTGSEDVTLEIPLDSQDLGGFELVITYDWANWQQEAMQPWDLLDSVVLDLPLPQNPSLVSTAGTIRLRNRFRKPRLSGYDVTLDSIGAESINWEWDSQDSQADLAYTEAAINVIPLLIQRVTTAENQPEQFDEIVDRVWLQTWCTATDRMDRAVFRVLGGDKETQIMLPDGVPANLTVWVNAEATDVRQVSEDTISVDLKPNVGTHVIELFTSQTRSASGLLQAKLPKITDAELVGQWYWHVILPRNECMISWPRRLTRAHHWDWSNFVPRRKSELTIAQLETWSEAMPTRALIHGGSSEHLFGVMGEPDVLSIRTAPLPLFVLLITGVILVAGSLLYYTRRPGIVLLLLGTIILGATYANPAFASVAGQFVAFGVSLVLLGQVLAWLLQQSPRAWSSSSSTPVGRVLEYSNQERRFVGTDQGSSQFRSSQ